jgi:hypothetical protein
LTVTLRIADVTDVPAGMVSWVSNFRRARRRYSALVDDRVSRIVDRFLSA